MDRFLKSPIQLFCDADQFQLNGHTFDQILEVFVGIVEVDGIGFAEMRITDEAGGDGLCDA